MAAKGSIFQPLNPDLPALPGFTAGQASAMAISPDGRTLLILTSGFNRNFGADGAKPVPEALQRIRVRLRRLWRDAGQAARS